MTVPFGGIKFTHTVGDFGEKGVCTGQFEFDIYDEFGHYGEALLGGASARLYEKNGALLPSREYFISKRSVSKKVCHFTAYDVMSKTDKDFDNSAFENAEKIPCGTVLQAVKNQCGFTSVSMSASSGSEKIVFTPDMLEGKKIRAVLEIIAAPMIGVWLADNDGGAVLSCLGEPYDHVSDAPKFAEIDMQGRQKITTLTVTDSVSGNIRNFSTGEYGTVLAVETPFPEACEAAWERVRNYVYTAWKCDKAILSDIYPDIPVFTKINFGENRLTANNVSVSADCTGVYFSGGTDPRDEEQWRYEEYTKRELHKRIKDGENLGKKTDTISFVDRNWGIGWSDKKVKERINSG